MAEGDWWEARGAIVTVPAGYPPGDGGGRVFDSLCRRHGPFGARGGAVVRGEQRVPGVCPRAHQCAVIELGRVTSPLGVGRRQWGVYGPAREPCARG